MKKIIVSLIICFLIFSVPNIIGCKGKEPSEEAEIAAEQAEDEKKMADVIEKNMTGEGPAEEGMMEGMEKEAEKEPEAGY